MEIKPTFYTSPNQVSGYVPAENRSYIFDDFHSLVIS